MLERARESERKSEFTDVKTGQWVLGFYILNCTTHPFLQPLKLESV